MSKINPLSISLLFRLSAGPLIESQAEETTDFRKEPVKIRKVLPEDPIELCVIYLPVKVDQAIAELCHLNELRDEIRRKSPSFP